MWLPQLAHSATCVVQTRPCEACCHVPKLIRSLWRNPLFGWQECLPRLVTWQHCLTTSCRHLDWASPSGVPWAMGAARRLLLPRTPSGSCSSSWACIRSSSSGAASCSWAASAATSAAGAHRRLEKCAGIRSDNAFRNTRQQAIPATWRLQKCARMGSPLQQGPSAAAGQAGRPPVPQGGYKHMPSWC